MQHDPMSEKFKEEITLLRKDIIACETELKKVIVGQDLLLDRLLLALTCTGHVLLEGMPGLAKTTAIKALAEVTDLTFKRIQFTPDLLPSDVVGTQIYEPHKGEFRIKKGPVFTNLLLADEINRAPAKVQSALLESMQERQVTLGEETFNLKRPFLVLATQNPIEQEGTYPLPEAQIDRFLFKVKVGYGSVEDEIEITRRANSGEPAQISPILSGHRILEIIDLVRAVYIDEKVRAYAVKLVHATREPEKYKLKDLKKYFDYGASPRASIALEQVAKARAAFLGRTYVVPQDVKDVALEIMRHRLATSFEAQADGIDSDALIKRILETVEVP